MSELYENLFNRIIWCSVLSPFFRLVALDCTSTAEHEPVVFAFSSNLFKDKLDAGKRINADNMQNENNLMTITIYVE